MALAIGATLIASGAIQADISGKAATRAADKQAEAAALGRGENARQFDITQKNLQPFLDAGTKAVGAQSDLTGLNGIDAQKAAFDNFVESPGQQFIRQRAQRNLFQNAASIGGVGGGNVRSALVEQGAGFAQQDFNNQFNRLNAIRTGGQSAGVNLGQFGSNKAAVDANLFNRGAEADASGILGAAQARTQFINNLTSGAGFAAGSR